MTRSPIGLHASTHLPDGQDPLPIIGTFDLPSAFFSNSTVLTSPITNPSAAQHMDFDTVQTSVEGEEYFSIVGGIAQLAAGFYVCFGFLEFASPIQDWHTIGGVASFGVSSQTLGALTLGGGQSISIGANPTELLTMSATVSIVSGSTFDMEGGFFADGTTTLPSGIQVLNAVVIRVSGDFF